MGKAVRKLTEPKRMKPFDGWLVVTKRNAGPWSIYGGAEITQGVSLPDWELARCLRFARVRVTEIAAPKKAKKR